MEYLHEFKKTPPPGDEDEEKQENFPQNGPRPLPLPPGGLSDNDGKEHPQNTRSHRKSARQISEPGGNGVPTPILPGGPSQKKKKKRTRPPAPPGAPPKNRRSRMQDRPRPLTPNPPPQDATAARPIASDPGFWEKSPWAPRPPAPTTAEGCHWGREHGGPGGAETRPIAVASSFHPAKFCSLSPTEFAIGGNPWGKGWETPPSPPRGYEKEFKSGPYRNWIFSWTIPQTQRTGGIRG